MKEAQIPLQTFNQSDNGGSNVAVPQIPQLVYPPQHAVYPPPRYGQDRQAPSPPGYPPIRPAYTPPLPNQGRSSILNWQALAENKAVIFRGALLGIVPFLPFASLLKIKNKQRRLYTLIGAMLGSLFMVLSRLTNL